MEKQTPPLLQVRGLSVGFGRYGRGFRKSSLAGVRDLSFTLNGGELLAVVGASGSGKSLLAHRILGILPANAAVGGQVLYEGRPLNAALAKRLRGREIVLVPQNVSYLDPMMRVGPQVAGPHAGREQKEKAARVLAGYGLGKEVQGKYPFELSGGMARRVLIATAVLGGPRLVVADEPTPGLHPAAAERVLGHFKEMAQNGAGVLLITHDLEAALKVADRVVVLYAGQAIEEALAASFASEAALQHPYTRALWRASPAHGFEALPGTQPVGELPQGCAFAPRCPRRGPWCGEPVPYVQSGPGFVRCAWAQGQAGGAGRQAPPVPRRAAPGEETEKETAQKNGAAAAQGKGLRAEAVTFDYPCGTRILECFDLAVAPGERVGVYAPSGRGKTTLCKLLAGYEKPKQGRILVDGVPLEQCRGYCPVQLVWQHPEQVVDPRLPLGRTLAEAGAPEERLMNALGIQPDWLARYPAELSGGELQRFCIARALAPGTRYLLADEVSAMLDLSTQAQLWSFLVEECARRGIGLVAVSHAKPLLDRVCTRQITL